MLAYCRADEVEGIFGTLAPGRERLIHSVLERLIATLRWDDGSTEHLHALDIDVLTLDIKCAHIDIALHTHECTGGSGGYTMLACTCLGDDAVLTHLLRQQDLPEGIIDLVRPRVIEVLALEVDLRTISLAESARVVEGAGTSYIVTQQRVELLLEVLALDDL